MRTLTAFLLPLLLVSTAVAQMPTPVMEYASVLTGLRIRHKTGVIEFENSNHALATVFLPPGTPVEAVLTKKGSKTPLARQGFAVAPADGAFNRISPRGALTQYAVKEAGEYTVFYMAGRQMMSSVDFRVDVEKNSDPFDAKAHFYLGGPWQKWAYMFAPLPDASSDQPEFRMWAHKRSFLDAPEADRYDIELRLNGDVVGVSSTGFVSTKEGRELRFKWRHPESKGGRAMKVSDLEGTNGTYHVVVKKNGELFGVWPFDVKEGRPQLHARQAGDYSPRTDYIVPRVSGLSNGEPGMVVFMERLSDSAAKAALEGKATKTAASQNIDRSRWNWIPRSVDPKRPFKMTVSDVETRTDTGFAVGEDMIVFGTGHPTGVKYMLAGDTKAREIPAGETFSSKVFCVCGRKIVLTKRSRIFVFDTRTENMMEISEEDISLYDPSNPQINSNGYLVATVNKATAVKDRTIIKVIDVSGETPIVIPIKNANYTDGDVTAVSVHAKSGNVAIASRSKKLIAAAKIAPLADQYLYDVSEYRGVASFQITIENDDVTYADEDWKVRRLELTSKQPRAITQEPIARSGNGFWVRKGRVVVVTSDGKVGSRYPMAVTDSADAPQTVPATGTAIEGTSAALGLGGSAAIAIDKTVFIAGTPGDSIGTGERLQAFDDERWMPILGEDGKPIWGSEVVSSMGFMALKVRDAAGKTVIGYATYGERISFDQPTNSVATSQPMTKLAGPVQPLILEDESTWSTRDEQSHELLKEYLKVDPDVLSTLEGAFGKEGARKKIIEMTVNAMTANNKEHLIDEFKRQSPLVPDKEKPAAEVATQKKLANVDPQAVATALNGEWKALRFTVNGEDLPDKAVETLQMVFSNGKYVMTMGGNIETGTYEFDSSTAPFSLTIQIGSGKNKGQSRHGSFKLLKGSRLMFVMATNAAGHPTKFVSTEENKNILAVYSKR